MGLAGEKRRGKLSQDPNNSAWSKSTDGFGHRILSQQGWKPGDYLGAENAAHGSHYTAANASHIRVLLREDNLGLGAKLGGAGNAETFGLSTLSGIFGRLNGKSEAEVEKQQSNLRDAELRTYQFQKHGYMNFVRGGLLVGDKIEELPDNKLVAKTVDSQSAAGEQTSDNKKKRKVDPDPSEDDESSQSEKKRRKAEADAAGSNTVAEGLPAESSVRTDKDLLKAAKRPQKEERRAAKQNMSEDAKGEKARLKQEKRARKEERRRRKEQKRLSKAARSADDAGADSTTASSSALTTPVVSELPSGTSTPTAGIIASSRNAVRQRYIMQKRAASMDPKALNEILMIKAIG